MAMENSETNEEMLSKKKSSFKRSLLIGFLILLGGIVFALLCANEILLHNKKSEEYFEVIGTVSRHNMTTNLLRAIVVEYTVNGEVYELESKKYSRNVEPVGDILSVKYNPDDPSDAIITYEKISIVKPISAGVIIIIGFIVIVKAFKKRFGKNIEVEEEAVSEAEKYEQLAQIAKSKNVSADERSLGNLSFNNVVSNDININVDNQDNLNNDVQNNDIVVEDNVEITMPQVVESKVENNIENDDINQVESEKKEEI